MILKIGDKVRFLNEVGGGRITAVVNKDMVNVETDDGFEVPTLINNLIVVNAPDMYESGRSRNTVVQPKTEPAKEKPTVKPVEPWFSDKNQVAGKDEPQSLFVLVPEVPANPPTGNISMYLVNNCNDTLLFRFIQKTKYSYETVAAGSASPNSLSEPVTDPDPSLYRTSRCRRTALPKYRPVLSTPATRYRKSGLPPRSACRVHKGRYIRSAADPVAACSPTTRSQSASGASADRFGTCTADPIPQGKTAHRQTGTRRRPASCTQGHN